MTSNAIGFHLQHSSLFLFLYSKEDKGNMRGREKLMWSEWGLLNLKGLNNPQYQPLAELKFSVALQHEVIGVGILAVYGMKVKSRP